MTETRARGGGPADDVAAAGAAALLDEARGHYQGGRLEEAYAAFRAVIAHPDATPTQLGEGWLGAGYVQLAFERDEDAVTCLTKALDCDPEQANAAYWLGRVALRRGDRPAARGWFERALAVYPGHASAERDLAELDHAERTETRESTSTQPGSGADAGNAATAADTAAISAQAALDWSLSSVLDRPEPPHPDARLDGDKLFSGPPSPASMATAAVTALGLLLIPPGIRYLAERTPNGWLRQFLAWGWHLAAAVLPVAAALVIVHAVLVWATTRYEVSTRRITLTRGVLRRRRVVVWLFEVERPPLVEQHLAEVLTHTASLVVLSDAVGVGRFRARSPLSYGRLRLAGLDAAVARRLHEQIIICVLRERRRMIANFMTR